MIPTPDSLIVRVLSWHIDGWRWWGITNPKGTKLETAAVNWFKAHGFPHARRRAKEGSRDCGDVSLGDLYPLTVECKNTRGFDLAGTQRELAVEMENARVPWGFAIHKKRGTTDVGKYYAVLPVEVLAQIIQATGNREVVVPPQQGFSPSRKRVIPRLRRVTPRSEAV